MDLRQLAEIGARARMKELHEEMKAIRELFAAPSEQKADLPSQEPRRKPMTAAQRKAVSRRMKAYWKARRGEQ
jgi:hypothetical protein